MLLTLLLTATSLARAEEKRDCANAITQSDMNQCASIDFDEADKELNAIWKTARETARKLDEQQHEGDMKGAEQALLAGQRGWIAYRDGHCELAGWEAHGGSMETNAGFELQGRTDARANQAIEGVYRKTRSLILETRLRSMPRILVLYQFVG